MAYEIAIKIAMSNGVSPILATIARDMLGLEMRSETLAKALNRVGDGLKYAVGGAAAMSGAYALIKGYSAIADRGEKLIHQQNAIYRATQNWGEAVQMTAKAYDSITKAVPTATGSDVLRSYNELRSVLGADRAAGVVPMSLKMEALLHNLTGQSAEGEGFKLWRALEMKGVTMSNPALADRIANQMVQIIAGSGGKVTASTFAGLAAQANTAWIKASPAAIGPYAVMAADLGGARAGTALMTLSQLLTGATTISRQQEAVLEQAGLLDMSKVKKVRGSNAMQLEPGAIAHSLDDANNIYKWVQDIAPNLHRLAATMKAAGANGTSADIFDSLIAKIGRNRNAIRMMTMFSDPGFIQQIDKDLALWDQSMTLDRAYGAMLGRPFMVTGPGGRVSEAASDFESGQAADRADYGAVKAAFWAQYDSMLEAAGGPFARAAIPLLKDLTDLFNSMGAWSLKHQDATKVIAQISGLGAAILGLGGAAALARGALLLLGVGSLTRGGAAATAGAVGAAGAAGGAGALGVLGRLGIAGAAGGMLYGLYKLFTTDASQAPEANKRVMRDLFGSAPGDQPQVIIPSRRAGSTHIVGWETPHPGLWESWQNATRASKSLHAAGYGGGLYDPELDREKSMLMNRAQGLSKPITVSPTMNVTNQVSVTIDGNSVAASIWPRIEQKIMGVAGFLVGPGATDAHSSYQSPGAVGHAGL